ncbi:unnamed protein product [Phytophthora lilii]|uniref:Unnamed protein product n=1 Tax=Phytophthora lilii TaxID=2077276 RepID=A0A9W6T8X6_9STRA|nr:unnamed protein product [Phytophthora lilii]
MQVTSTIMLETNHGADILVTTPNCISVAHVAIRDTQSILAAVSGAGLTRFEHTVRFSKTAYTVEAMGLCALRRMNAEDRQQEKIGEFVRYAITSDLVKLREMITKQKMDPNAKDVSTREHSESNVESTYDGLLFDSPSNGSNRVVSARLSTHQEVYNEPVNAEPKRLDFIGLALPIRRGSRSVERTDVRSFRSRRSVTDYSDHTARNSIDEPNQWANPPMSKPAALYVSPPVSMKEHAPMRKNLRYAGKRVIMAIRVKSAIPDIEKLQLMRLMLQKYTKPSPDAKHIHS